MVGQEWIRKVTTKETCGGNPAYVAELTVLVVCGGRSFDILHGVEMLRWCCH